MIIVYDYSLLISLNGKAMSKTTPAVNVKKHTKYSGQSIQNIAVNLLKGQGLVSPLLFMSILILRMKCAQLSFYDFENEMRPIGSVKRSGCEGTRIWNNRPHNCNV